MNYLQRATRIVEAYCNQCSIDPQEFAKDRGKKKKPKLNGRNVSPIRLVLAKYLAENFEEIKQQEIGKMIGLRGHSMVNRCKHGYLNRYIETKDPVIYPHWESLLNLVNTL